MFNHARAIWVQAISLKLIIFPGPANGHQVYILSFNPPLFLSTSLCACVVVPKKVASYDEKCKLAVQKMGLDIAAMESDDKWVCTQNDCAWDISRDIAQATFTVATSAVIASSIALAGNTMYWLERNGECPNEKTQQHQPPHKRSPTEQQQEKNGIYTIEEEIVTAKS